MREPDLTESHPNAFRSAWRLSVQSLEPHAVLARWLLYCPKLHAAWSHWTMSVAHLRPVEGLPPAVLHKPGAQYELIVAALEPRDGAIDPDDRSTMRMMQPIDVCEQFALPPFAGDVAQPSPDELAVLTVDELARMVVEFRLHPDSDFRSTWEPAIPYAGGTAYAAWRLQRGLL